MGKSKVKKKKGLAWRIKRKIKRKIVQLNKSEFFNLYFLVSLLSVLAILFSLYLTKNLLLEKNTFLWLFSATSQSMAALFALVGMFAIFRYQFLEARLKNLYESLKRKFSSNEWKEHFGETDAASWEDSLVAAKAENLLTEKKEELPAIIENNLDVDIVIIKLTEDAKVHILSDTKILLTSVFITFMLSVVSIPCSGYISKNFFGFLVLLILLLLITFSMTNIFRYFIISIKFMKIK